ncbi:MAG: GIY-YIG nuclease family protein [Clostridia bacterium]|nr:GIY-YIG nuclease family protein [Clostridia bacterium]
MYYVYILRCENNYLYTGITTDVERRFREHSDGVGKGAKYTRAHKPLGVEAVWKAEGKSDASKMEHRIKKLKKDEKEKLIQDANADFIIETDGITNRFERIL